MSTDLPPTDDIYVIEFERHQGDLGVSLNRLGGRPDMHLEVQPALGSMSKRYGQFASLQQRRKAQPSGGEAA